MVWKKVVLVEFGRVCLVLDCGLGSEVLVNEKGLCKPLPQILGSGR